MEADIICVGQAVVDCITRGMESDPDRPGSNRAESITLSIGGDAVNEAVARRRLGFRSAVVAGVGDDPAGKTIHELSPGTVPATLAAPLIRSPRNMNLFSTAPGRKTERINEDPERHRKEKLHDIY